MPSPSRGTLADPKVPAGNGTANRGASAARGGVADIQRARMVAAMVEVVRERGVARVAVAHVVARSGVSRRTFYELFEDRDECLMAAFELALARAAHRVGVPVLVLDRPGQLAVATDRRQLPTRNGRRGARPGPLFGRSGRSYDRGFDPAAPRGCRPFHRRRRAKDRPLCLAGRDAPSGARWPHCGGA